MKVIHAVGFVAALFVASTVSAQHTQFDEHDRQVTNDWYKQHQTHAPAGFRTQDRLSAEQESRLQAGHVLPRDLRGRTHTVPSELRHQLPAPPRNHTYVSIGGHVILINSRTHEVRDVIHLH
jgi:Ni/Co efflux regulator RcnB